ncbi:alpha/beta fold hydrolase [Photobacterium carnosum]|uniref:alpha/beta fold hydrolase n=1 Tax=Photobacterium carnosum TaxID=2023717 RepID=UPI001E5AB264|nr:alpha/beta fold hydrolase [Photobacterium carnosum]MCD9544061.1 alpha/beta fold hydrolase [Photobacterium carnosum]
MNVPLNYEQITEGSLTIFAREVVHKSNINKESPWLVYLQGGPGFAAPRPEANSGWLRVALKYYRVLLLDQRGTGASSAISHQTLAAKSPQQQAEYLTHFRADNIVRDAEQLRQHLGIDQWALLGQSFGGFCALHYLSFYPHSLSRVFMTGGIPSLTATADEVYQATYKRVADKNKAFFKRFAGAQQQCNAIAEYIINNKVYLPNEQLFTVEQFQTWGITLGGTGGDLAMYYALESAFVEVEGQQVLSYTFLNTMLNQQSYQTNPIYAILHEAIYCQQQASDWAAERVRQQYPQYHYQKGSDLCFTGEMVYPWMFDQMTCLQPLREAAHLLAAKEDWPLLYCEQQLAKNTVPIAAAVYVEDMYVEYRYSCETLALLANAQSWQTNQYEHNGLRVDGEYIFERLITLADSM